MGVIVTVAGEPVIVMLSAGVWAEEMEDRASDAREIRREDAARFIRNSRAWNTNETCVPLQDTPLEMIRPEVSASDEIRAASGSQLNLLPRPEVILLVCQLGYVEWRAMPSGSEQIVDLYRRHAREWAHDRDNQLLEAAWLDRFRNLLPVGANILDVGCGSGEPIARYFIGNGYAVTGVDSSPEMIALCHAQLPDGEWCVSDMRALCLGRVFSGILAWDSFFHLCHEDQRRMFPIFREHSAPRAALMFTSGTEHGIAIGSYKGESLYHASLSSAEYRALLQGQGFEVMEHVIGDPICDRTIWLAQLK